MRNLNVRAVVHLLNATTGFAFALSITMEMDTIAHVSYRVKLLAGVEKIDYCFCLMGSDNEIYVSGK